MKTCLLISAIAFATASTATHAAATSPWLPIPGQLALTLNHTVQSGETAIINKVKVPIIAITRGEASEFERSTTSLILNYGISDALALDAIIGYGDVDAGVSENDSDISDAVIGLSWRLVDEYLGALPTITTRVGVIIAGDYEDNQLASIGDGQNGLDVSLLVGKQLTGAFALSAEVGHQNRNGDVPDAFYYSVTASYSFLEKLSASIGYSVHEYAGDLDLNDPEFSANPRYKQVRAQNRTAKIGLNYSLAGNQALALNLGTTIDGRNTVDDDTIIGLSYTYGF